MIGIKNNIITVLQLYDYAYSHNLLNADATQVLAIIRSEKTKTSNNASNDNIGIVIFDEKVEYTTEDLLILFST